MITDEKILKDLGSQFKQARDLIRFKQSEVAEAAGINSSYYAQIERGEVNTTFANVYRIAKALNIKNIEIN
ncbi:MAG: helix-turn-helix transcriptional regulator [bacterium]